MYGTFVCMVILGLVAVVRINGCPDGWKKGGNGKCYLFVKERKNHAQAKANCEANGGYLAEPRTAEENKFIANGIEVIAIIGYNDAVKEGHFVGGHTKSPLTYKNWRLHEPNNWGNGEDCVGINYPHRKNGLWVDVSCRARLRSVCEQRKGWRKYINGKWYLFVNEEKTHAEAKANCEANGGYLAEPRTEGENKVIANGIKDRAFIGYNDDVKEKHFVGGHTKTPVTFAKWNKNEPNNNRAGEDCVEILKDGFWNDISCGKRYSSVCEYINPCPKGWSHKGTKCYIVASRKASWDKAQASCARIDGFLPEPMDEKENAIVAGFHNGARQWIGLSDKAVEGTYVWKTDEKEPCYTNWHKGEPNNGGNREDCTEINYGHHGKWNDAFCGESFPYVCQMNP